MRKSARTVIAVAAGTLGALFVGAALHAGDDDAEGAKVAKDALDKAVAKGNELFHSKDFAKKSCAGCHENPDKPELNLANRAFHYPAYSRKAKAVVSMGQKINEMLSSKSGSSEKDLAKSPELVAVEAYIESIRKK